MNQRMETTVDKSRASLQRSLIYLRNEIKNGTWLQGSRIPSIRILARQAQVSAAAMCAARAQLREEGVITVIKNRGAYLGKAKPLASNNPTATALEESQRWQRLKTQIERDVFEGTFTAGEPMPSLRDLQKIYSVSYKPLRKAIEAIAAEGVVVPFKKTYMVPHLRRAHGTLVFICSPDASSRLFFGGYPMTEFLYALHREGGKSMINISVQTYDPTRRRTLFTHQLQAIQERHSVLGYIVWTGMLPDRKLEQVLQSLKEVRKPDPQHAGLEKPVAVIDTTWETATTQNLHRQSDSAGWAFRVFTVAGLAAGRQVGQHLLKAGHRKVAFLSYCHKELWSQYRYRGLVQAFQGAGFGDGVHKFVIEEIDDRLNAMTVPSDIEEYLQRAKNFLAVSEEATHRYYADYALEQMQASIWNFIHQLKIAKLVEPLLASALEEPGITAWVAVNDRMALLARDHLTNKGVRIPKDMSVVGFDDSKAATDNDITSYSFAFAEIARKVLVSLLSPRRLYAGRDSDFTECDGLLIERGSTSPQRGG